jgi:hypothetical protein
MSVYEKAFASTAISAAGEMSPPVMMNQQQRNGNKKKQGSRPHPRQGLLEMFLDGLCACSDMSCVSENDESQKLQRRAASYNQYLSEPSSSGQSSYRLRRVNSDGTLSTVPMSDRSFLDDENEDDDSEGEDDDNSSIVVAYHEDEQRDDREDKRHKNSSLRRPTSFDKDLVYASALDSHVEDEDLENSIAGVKYSCFHPYIISTFASEFFESRSQSSSTLYHDEQISSLEKRRLILARHFSQQLL